MKKGSHGRYTNRANYQRDAKFEAVDAEANEISDREHGEQDDEGDVAGDERVVVPQLVVGVLRWWDGHRC